MAENSDNNQEQLRTLSDTEKAVTIAVFRKIAKSRNWNARYCSVMLDEFGQRKIQAYSHFAKEYPLNFSLSERSFRDYLNNGTNPKTDSYINALHIWLKTDFRKEYQREQIASLAGYHAQSISSLANLFLADGELHIKTLESLAGRYCLYRPSHLNPDRDISLVEFRIGIYSGERNANICSCSFSSNYLDEGEEDSTYAKGHIVVDRSTGAALLQTTVGKPLMLMIDFIDEPTAKDTKISAFSGILIAGVKSVSSAWPFYAERISDSNDEFIPKTVPFDELKLKKAIYISLNRGSIRWEEHNFLGWPHKKSDV